ncbi:hypothetical protein ACFPRL_36280 [Pseudoclavibacter helvolus]
MGARRRTSSTKRFTSLTTAVTESVMTTDDFARSTARAIAGSSCFTTSSPRLAAADITSSTRIRPHAAAVGRDSRTRLSHSVILD